MPRKCACSYLIDGRFKGRRVSSHSMLDLYLPVSDGDNAHYSIALNSARQFPVPTQISPTPAECTVQRSVAMLLLTSAHCGAPQRVSFMTHSWYPDLPDCHKSTSTLDFVFFLSIISIRHKSIFRKMQYPIFLRNILRHIVAFRS